MSQCRLVGYSECRMESESVTYTETEVVTDGVFRRMECVEEFRKDKVVRLQRISDIMTIGL